MANQISGKILYIYPTQSIPSKDGNKQYSKRNVVIDCSHFNSRTGEKYENTPMLEFFGDQCAELDQYQAGQEVTISFDVQGTRYRNRDNQEQIFTRLRPYKIELVQARQTAPAQQPSPAPQAAKEDDSDLPF